MRERERTDRPTPTLCFVLFLCERRRPGHDAIVSTWTRRETRGEAWKRHPPVESKFQTLV